MRFVERLDHRAVGGHALVRLHDPRIQQLGQHDVAVEDARALLVADAQRIAEAARGDEQGGLALALEQCVGGDRRAHLHALHLLRRDRLAGREAEEMADPGDRRVAVLLGVLGEQLERTQRAVRRTPDQISERAAAVDPELPVDGC